MSETSFVKSLFFGAIEGQALFPYPLPGLPERQALMPLLDGLQRAGDKYVDSARIDREGTIPAGVLAAFAKTGILGMSAPKRLGGLGLSLTSAARAVEELAGIDGSLATFVGAHHSLALRSILLFGTDAQKEKFIPKLARGEAYGAFALTETGAGSDAGALATFAEPTTGGYRLRGEKVWVTNGAEASIFVVFARTSAPEQGKKPRITAMIVERGPGVSVVDTAHTLGVRGTSTTKVVFDDVFVPDEHALGERGRGFKVAMGTLAEARLPLAAGCLGLGKKVTKLTAQRAIERRAFGRHIGDFGLVKDMVAENLAELYGLESATYLGTGLYDAGPWDTTLESACSKVLGSEIACRTTERALRIAGGTGFSDELPFERLFRDARANLTFEGTNEILRCFIALSGMAGPARELSDVARAMREPVKGFGLLSDFARRKAKTAFGRERLLGVHPALSGEAAIFEEYVVELAKYVDKMLRKHENNIAEMQFAQKRVSGMAMELYAIGACLARTTRAMQERGEEGARREYDLCALFVGTAAKRLRDYVEACEKNDDPLRKAVAQKAYLDGGYPLDIF
jgi:acyl-CoA dehydrogenase family protein 9